MSFILHIDTAAGTALISISENEKVIATLINDEQKKHASFVHPAIKLLLQQTGITPNTLNAVALTSGPGSYTGLRVGMAAAKGLCYALNIPLITLGTLEVMAKTLIDQVKDPSAFYCPMMDARRMEVFTAVYDHKLDEIIKPCALILEEAPFKELTKSHPVFFTGSGASKMQQFSIKNIIELNNDRIPAAMALLADKKFNETDFADVAYSQPTYLKEFYSTAHKRP